MERCDIHARDHLLCRIKDEVKANKKKKFVRTYDSVLRTDHGTIGLVQMS